ncbi:MAG: glycosyltransferase [Planctomycetota bacterium]
MRIAFVGIGQHYPSHVWMGRMRETLKDRIVVNVDDLRNVARGTTPRQDTLYLPRKLPRPQRLLRAIGLSSRSNRSMRSQWMLATLSEHRPTLVFTHFLDFAVQFSDVWRTLGVPVVVHCHGYDITWNVRSDLTGQPLHPVGYTNAVRSMPDNVWFIANSTFTRDQLLSLGIRADKIAIKRFGVPLAERPKPVTDGSPKTMLYLGRLVDFKGPLETARAFAAVAKRHRDAKLEIAGDGCLVQPLDHLLQSLDVEGQTVRHGSVDPIRAAELRRRAAVFTAHNKVGHPSGQVEAFGVSLLEAMGEGVPVVTGRCGGLIDFVHHDTNGFLFEPGDVDAHAHWMAELIDNTKLRRRLGEAAWETVRDNYQEQHELDDMNQFFDHVSRTGTSPLLTGESIRRAA